MSVVRKSAARAPFTCVGHFRNCRKLISAALAVFALAGLLGALSAAAQVNVTTYHNDIGRTGQNLSETALNLSNVNATQFGKLFSQPVDGQIYAQPLYMSNVTINGATHNVVYVATEHDSVYAFDADLNSGVDASPLWQISFLSSAHGAAAGATTVSSNIVSTDISPEVGITGTPVIDPTTNTMYIVGKTMENSKAVQRLHALDITSGAEKFGGPVVITATVAGTGNGSVSGSLTFDPLWENQRPGLLLLNGIVYIGFAAHGDNGPWHGWILGYNAGSLTQVGAYNASPNGTGSGFWMSGEGLAADVPAGKPYGRMFVPTGNGDYNATKPYTNSMDYGDSHLVLDLTNGQPTVVDEFTTNQQATLNSQDGDVGSGGMIVLPDQTGPYAHLAVQAGKGGTLYLLNRDNMGGYNTTTDQALQEQGPIGTLGVWSTPAYWNGNVYYWGRFDYLKSFPLLSTGLLSTTPTKSSETYGYPGSTPSISANGTSQGIVWSINSSGYANSPATSAILQAHSASNVAITLYSSATNAARDAAGVAVKFTVPTVANGKVYVGTSTELDIYGLINGNNQTTAPVITPGTENYSGTVSVTITDATAGASIYYTTDGSAATTSSTLYTGPITVSSTQTINAVASASGLLVSAQSSATYTNVSQAAAVTFSLPTGTYGSAQSVTLTDSTPNATIYYTLDGSTPTTSSTVYTSAITVGATETITAVANAPGLGFGPVISQTYTIQLGATGISYGQGFAASTGQVILNGAAQLNDSRLQLTDGGTGQAATAWYKTPVNIQTFTNDFTFQLSNPVADGITFAIQNGANAYNSLGGNTYALGYAPIANSIAVKFDLYNSAGEGSDSTGLYLNGANPTVPAIDLTSTGINLHSDDAMAVHMTYDGTTLTMRITDMVTSAQWSTSWAVNIPSAVGGNTAYVGFTGSTGAYSSSQKILTWSFVSSAPSSTVAATPTFSVAAGTYASAQSVTLSDSTTGASIYYTTNGSTPTTSSTLYSGPITVSSTETINAIAVASGYTNSAVATAAYTIATPAATPTLSVAGGTYTSAQTVTISDTTTGATIYYTLDGSTPTTSSAVYSAAIKVSSSETIKAIAVASGYSTSATASAAYIINLPAAATPTFSPAAGTYTSAQTIALSDTTAGATIYYTTDGTTPTTSSTAYSGTFVVNASKTVKAIAVASGYSTSATASAAYVINLPAATPTFSLVGGSYTSTQTVSISDTTTGATIYYTTNGTTPTTSSTVFSGPITVSSTQTINAIAVATGYSTSAVASATYTITTSNQVAAPVFSLPGGTYNAEPVIAMSDATPGAVIHYLITGATPTATSPVYTAPITFNQTRTVIAYAVAPGMTDSTYTSATYTLVCSPPVATPVSGTYTSTQTVTLTTATPHATIFFSTDNTLPGSSSKKYTTPLTVSTTSHINAIAIQTGFTDSTTLLNYYVINSGTASPTFSPVAGTYTSAQTVTISDATSGATIYYTTNGTTPTTSSTVYSGPITVSSTQTVKAIAVTSSLGTSSASSAVYTITPPAATPTFSVAAGTYASSQTVTISDATSGAAIYYTTNGTAPTTSSTLYSGPVTISASSTLKAIATASGYSSSAVASAAYTITPPTAAPVFSLAAGTYSTTQTVTLTDATAGASIYYTTDGSTPSTSSTLYSGAITVSASETINAIAIATGYSASSVTSAAYTISTATPVVNFASQFTTTGLNFNGARIINNVLQLTDGGAGEGHSAWFTTPVNVQKFTTDFNFLQASASADGFTFVIQAAPKTIYALGGNGAALGYGGITNSVAVKFDLYSNAGEGSDSTGFYTNGATPTVPSVDMSSSGINLHSGDTMHAHITYDGTTLTLTITDTVTNASFTTSTAINIPMTVGGNTAYVGFTGGTGGLTAIQNVLNWTYTVN
jgi:hypothetical protein